MDFYSNKPQKAPSINNECSIYYFKTHEVPLKLIRSARKSLALYIRKEGILEVKAPLKMSLKLIESFILQKQNWIHKHLEPIFIAKQEPKSNTNQLLEQGGTCFYLGEAWNVQVYESNQFYIKTHLETKALDVYCPTSTPVSERLLLLQQWEFNTAKILILNTLKTCWEVFHSDFQHLKTPTFNVKRLKSRWGSCSSKHVICINALLFHFPKKFLNYIIFHEFCHLIHFNHSSAFYELQAKYIPNYKELKEELKSLQYQINFN